MRSVGVRELLRLVQRGETLEITDRGRPVARLSPVPDDSPLEQLRLAGELQSATADLDDLPQPVVPDPGQELPSVTLAGLRHRER